MPRSKQDPLIAALIAKLPKTGEDWSVDQQLAWLRLMAMAFGNVYGGNVALVMTGATRDSLGDALAAIPRTPPRRPALSTAGYRYHIDAEGFARADSGKRVLPSDVIGPIFDARGEDGDMRTIIWADDSKGLNGADLVITA